MTDIAALAVEVDADEQIAGRASIEYSFETWTASGASVDTVTRSNVAHPVEFTYNDQVAEHVARHDPERERAEVALKRLILTDHQPVKLDGKQYCVGCDPANLTAWWESCPYIKALEAIYTEGSAS